MKQRVTSGTIITDGKSILLGHSNGNNFWDLPKGMVEEGETVLEAAIRECKEEFGYDLDESNMKDLGRFKYNSKKDINLFLYRVSTFPDLNDLSCYSHFDRYGGHVPEIDGYKLFSFEDAGKNMSKVMNNLFISEYILEKIK